MAGPTRVSDELARRRNCRVGLRGLRVAVADEIYRIEGSWWDKNRNLQLCIVPVNQWYPTWQCKEFIRLSEVPSESNSKSVAATECDLVDEWPVVCCRPNREAKK